MKAIWTRIWEDIKKYKWFTLGFLIYYVITHMVFGAYCPQLLITGLPCPGCGMSRAMFFVITFQFTRAWNMNPIAFIWVLLIFVFVLLRYVLGKSTKHLRMALIITLILTIGIYMGRMFEGFPQAPPIVYRGNNMFEQIIPHYREIIMRVFYH